MRHIKRIAILAATVVGWHGLLERSRAAEPAADARPNFIFILIDDMGWTDAGCCGSKYYETPQIDRLAAQGMRFTNAYAACCVCSPTRAAIMTGKYPARLHITDWIPGQDDKNPKNLLLVPKWQKFLPLEEVTIAEALKDAGYISAAIGKWHLGNEPYYPQHQGFDLNVAGSGNSHTSCWFWPYEKGPKPVPGLKKGGHPGEYLTDRLADEAEKFIEKNRDRPFFLYLAHFAVHLPLGAKAELIAKYNSKPPQGGHRFPVYAAMLESVDESVGRILAKLDALGIDDRTVVIFTSDNGGHAHRDGWPTSNAPLRAGKNYPYEGGLRVPLIVKWPGAVKSGTLCSVPVHSIDFFPTLLDMAGCEPVKSNNIDGVSIVPLLKQTGTLQRETLFWHYPHYCFWPGFKHDMRPNGVVRSGDWKLIEWYENSSVELYNLKDDLGEQTNLAEKFQDKAEELRRRLSDWRDEVDAQMPLPNPNIQKN